MNLNWGISTVGREESLHQPSALKEAGVSAVRLPVHLPLVEEELACAKNAHAAGLLILAVVRFQPTLTTWADHLTKAVQELPFVAHWEMESEADDPRFGWPADDLATYATSLIKAAMLIKSHRPHALIHNGGLGRSLPKGISRLCALGAGPSVDIWNVHPYTNPLMPDAAGCLRYFQDMIQQTLARENQKEKPIWWSSIACPGMQDPKSAANWWLGKNTTEAAQAEWLKTAHTVADRAGIAQVFWEGWQDKAATPRSGIDYFGLLHADGSAKQALFSLSEL